ncbi:HAD family hydrolase [Deinococcus sp. A31D244]|uniref:HAD family hydrolase n=1 Tax=Deinococcus sp. A31D244 TaxID=3397675 RepID=UPI0039E02F69
MTAASWQSGGIVAFADLDDTLFQTLRKLPGTDPATLTPMTVNTLGQPHSHAAPAQTALLELLSAGHVTLIPVTGRDAQAMRRVTLPFRSWQVMDHGLTILTPDGQPDAAWAAQVTAHLHPLQDALHAGTEAIAAPAAQMGARLTRHAAHGLPFMTVLKHPDADPQVLADLQDRWDAAHGPDSPLRVIANANNVSLLPRHLGKAAAVRYLLGEHLRGAALTLGLGDSVSDLGFMDECDFAVTPRRGQLMRTLRGLTLPQR